MRWLKRKVLLPVKNAIKNGISHKRLAVSLALGITIGLIPFYGITTLLVGILAIVLRLDFVVMQVVHYVVHPLQLILLIPFFKIGSIFVANDSVDFSVKEYILLFKSNFWMAISELWKTNLSAIVVWMVVAIPLFYGLYILFHKTITRYASVHVH
jgi:uncharacterized protein (DUF2062 family)